MVSLHRSELSCGWLYPIRDGMNRFLFVVGEMNAVLGNFYTPEVSIAHALEPVEHIQTVRAVLSELDGERYVSKPVLFEGFLPLSFTTPCSAIWSRPSVVSL